MKRPKDVRTLRSIPTLDDDHRMRRALEESRAARLAELDEAFSIAAQGRGTEEKAGEVKTFLSLVIKNIESYRTRARVRKPETGEVIEVDWIELCGGTIRELGLDAHLARLVFEYVSSLLPPHDESHRGKLAAAAGMEKIRSVSPGQIETLKKKGILAAFVAKLFVDSKVLVWAASLERAEAYFDGAAGRARALMDSKYLTGRDRKFLGTCRKNYGGDLEVLVGRQRDTVLSDIRKRSAEFPVVGSALTRLLSGVFEVRAVRDMDDWFTEAQNEFTPERYVYDRLDEFRAELRDRMAALERRPLPDSIGVAKAGARKIAELTETFNRTVAGAGVGIELPLQGNIDLFQALRARVEELGRPDVVEPFDRFISSEELLDTYAQYEVARFKKDEPTLRQRINADLIIWDEVYRSAPLNRDQESRIESLKDEMTRYVEELGRTIPGEVHGRSWIIPFAMGVFELLKTEGEFGRFLKWLDRVRAIFDESTEHTEPMRMQDLKALEETQVGAAVVSARRAHTDEWVPKLGDATVTEPPGRILAGSHRAGRTRSIIGRWRGWPWNWFKR